MKAEEKGRDAVRSSQTNTQLDRLRLRGPNGARNEISSRRNCPEPA